jgi:hypothetical protein
MDNKPRKRMLCGSSYTYPTRYWGDPGVSKRHPYILIKGVFFKEYGFNIGDQVTITNPKPGALLMKVTKTAAQMDQERSRNNHEIKLLKLEQKHAA